MFIQLFVLHKYLYKIIEKEYWISIDTFTNRLFLIIEFFFTNLLFFYNYRCIYKVIILLQLSIHLQINYFTIIDSDAYQETADRMTELDPSPIGVSRFQAQTRDDHVLNTTRSRHLAEFCPGAA